MPTTVNGVGTWYYGKKNCINYDDYCPYCNRYVTLSSYDTREWVVVVFVPIIPLGRKRIMNSCPICRRHKQLSLKKYLKLKDADYAAAMEKYDANPNDPEAVAELLGVFSAYQDIESFEALAGQAAEQFADNAKIQTTIGSIYYNYGNMEQARQHLEKSLSLKDEQGVHELLGFVCLRLSNVDQAAGHFQHIIDQRIQNKAKTLLALVDGFQGQGRHQDALALMDVIVEIDPAVGSQKIYKKSRKLSEKNLHSAKPIKNKQFVHGMPKRGERTPFSNKKAWAIAAMVLVCIFLAYMAAALYMGKNAKVYLVNGLNRPYEVMLDGQSYSIPEAGYTKIKLSEGIRQLTVPDSELSIAAQTLEMHSSFWKRPFLDRVYVINPDTVAMLQWTKIFYAEHASQAPEPEWKLHVGQVLYIFDGIQFPFKEFPDEISLSGSSPEARIQVSMMDEREVSREQFPSVIDYYLGFEAKIDFLKKCLYYEPDNIDSLYGLYSEVDPKTFIETLRPGLDVFPVRIEWHRLYQNALELSNPQYDLQSEYRQRLDKSPENSALRYLYGRVLKDDHQQTQQWFQKAVEGSAPCGYGYFALGYDAMAAAEFKDALSYFEKAIMIEPENPFFCSLYYEMLVANNQLTAACEYCAKQVLSDSDNYTWIQEHGDLLCQLGRSEEADRVFEQWCRQNKDVYSPEDFQSLRLSNQLNHFYQDGNFEAIQRLIGEPNELEDQVLLTLHNRETLSDALMAQAASFPVTWKLLFYISESQLGNKDNAALFLTEAAKQLKAGNYAQRYIGECLSLEKPVDEQKICSLPMEVPLKVAALTSLGIKFPEHRDAFWDLAERLNYKKAFPYHFLNFIYEAYPKQTAAGKEINAKQI